MNFQAEINIMPLKELLDPQGKTVSQSMKRLQLDGVQDVRIGKHISINLDAKDEADASAKVELACKKLLANPIMEKYSFSITPNN